MKAIVWVIAIVVAIWILFKKGATGASAGLIPQGGAGFFSSNAFLTGGSGSPSADTVTLAKVQQSPTNLPSVSQYPGVQSTVTKINTPGGISPGGTTISFPRIIGPYTLPSAITPQKSTSSPASSFGTVAPAGTPVYSGYGAPHYRSY